MNLVICTNKILFTLSPISAGSNGKLEFKMYATERMVHTVIRKDI